MWSTNLDALLDRNARFWAPAFASRWCIPASLLLSAAMIIYLVALVTHFGTYRAACAGFIWTTEQIRWAGWLIPAYEFSHTLIVGEFLGLAALLGTSAILRLVSLAHQFNCKMRS